MLFGRKVKKSAPHDDDEDDSIKTAFTGTGCF